MSSEVQLAGSGARVEQLEWFELSRAAPEQGFEAVGLRRDLAQLVEERVQPGSRVGVAVGSRGIARVGDVVAEVVQALQRRGVSAVLIPAMGSHGGATPAGQRNVLHELGINEGSLGVPIDASMEVVEVGKLASGKPVYLAHAALACDGVVLVNRVKPHSDFRAPIESGLTKMLTIGLGKEAGASSLHSAGFEAFSEVLPEAARVVLASLWVPFGVALLEDAWHRVRRVEVVPGELLLERDQALLLEAWGYFARLPFEEVDVLILREIGKMISGAGMDPNVTGRFAGKELPAGIGVGRLAVLDLTENSGGNAMGVGQADIVTERLRSKIDWTATYANAAASKSLAGAKLPFVARSDLEALSLAMFSLTGTNVGALRLVAMANTLEVNHIAVSKPLVAPAGAAGYSLVHAHRHAEFNTGGSLLRIGGLEFFADAETG
jgi:hypothetical protein